MSDDEYFYDDELDEFEGDLFWNDDGQIVLADDLAEHTFPSPVYAEDAAYETLNGYSDWEYYSDDYYDDDPGLLKGNPQEGSPVRSSRSNRPNEVKRGRKRKLAATRDIPALHLDDDRRDGFRAMRPWFKGTVWRLPSAEPEQKTFYEPGKGERVALLDNWREVFKASPPTLAKPRSKPSQTRRDSQQDRQMAGNVARIGDSQLPDPSASNVDEDVKATHDDDDDDDDDDEEGEEEVVEISRNPKRQKLSVAAYPQSPKDKPKIVVVIPSSRMNGVMKSKSDHKEKVQRPPPSKKRKASDVENEVADAPPSQPRAKRLAAGKFSVKSTEKKQSSSVATARTTRSQKK